MLDSTKEMRRGWKSLPSNNYTPISAVLVAMLLTHSWLLCIVAFLKKGDQGSAVFGGGVIDGP